MATQIMETTPTPLPVEEAETGLDALTAAETAMAERKAGQSVTTLGNDAFPQVSLIGALGWVLFRRQDSRMTFEKYMESRTVAQITDELGLRGDEGDDEGKDDG